jgi:hypothetical protein
MAQQSNSAAVVVPRDGGALRTQTALYAEQLVLPLHQVNHVATEQHLLLSKSVLKELLRRNQAFVLENVHLQKSIAKNYLQA